MEEHEDPYIVEGNDRPLVAGHAFSVEPGIYVAGRWGMRLEDIVVATDDGPDPLNHADHALSVRLSRQRSPATQAVVGRSLAGARSLARN